MEYLQKKNYSLSQIVMILAATLLGIAAIGYASSVTLRPPFTSGTTISSSEMNANFTAIKAAVDDNHSRITALEHNKTKIAFSQDNTCCSTVTATAKAHQSVSIDAPSSGNVVVSFTGICTLSHITGQHTSISYAISQTSGQTASPSRGAIQVPSPSPTGPYLFSLSAQQVFPVSAGTATFYFNVDNTSTGAGGVTIGWGNLHALFIPN